MGQKQNIQKNYNSEKMHRLLANSVERYKEIKTDELKGKYDETKNQKLDSEDNEKVEEKEEKKEDSDELEFSFDDGLTYKNKDLKIKNKEKYPYSSVGILKVKFPLSEDIYEYICFLIDKNIIVTLESNLYNEEKGGKASFIKTSFNDKEIKWDNIHLQSDKINKENKNKKNKKNENEIEKLSIKLAVIIEKNVGNEWFGVKYIKKEDFSYTYIKSIFLMNIKEDKDINKKEESIFGEIEFDIKSENPFLKAYNSEEVKDKELISKSQGSPIYYFDFSDSYYVIGMINQNYDIEYFNKEIFEFLYEEERSINKFKEGIDQDYIINLECENNNLGPRDMEYLIGFDLINLEILDLSGNSIKTEGARILSGANFKSLKNLNLNFNQIGDDGLNYICSSNFQYLNQLHLFYNNISSEGIKYLVKAKFISRLEVLSLSENPNIKEEGVIIIKENDVWKSLKILHMNATGLTDNAITILNQAKLPKLKTLSIQGHKFSESTKKIISDMIINDINVIYKIKK